MSNQVLFSKVLDPKWIKTLTNLPIMFSEIRIVLSLMEIIGDPKKNQDDRSLFVILYFFLGEMRFKKLYLITVNCWWLPQQRDNPFSLFLGKYP